MPTLALKPSPELEDARADLNVAASSTPLEDVARKLNDRAKSMGAIEAGLNLDARVEAARAAIRLAVHDAFPGRIALVSSFGAESAALLRLVADVEPNLPVIFLETGKHFAQTISYRKKIAAMFGLTNVIDARPDSNELAAQDPNGDLWRRDADACCALRKVRPLNEALDSFDAWITGRKQFQGGLRAGLPAFEASNGKVKVNPLTAWTPEDIAAFGVRAELPPHPLVAQGFASIGCWPCTKPIEQGEDQRAGRWRGADKTECGIHTI